MDKNVTHGTEAAALEGIKQIGRRLHAATTHDGGMQGLLNDSIEMLEAAVKEKPDLSAKDVIQMLKLVDPAKVSKNQLANTKHA